MAGSAAGQDDVGAKIGRNVDLGTRIGVGQLDGLPQGAVTGRVVTGAVCGVRWGVHVVGCSKDRRRFRGECDNGEDERDGEGHEERQPVAVTPELQTKSPLLRRFACRLYGRGVAKTYKLRLESEAEL